MKFNLNDKNDPRNRIRWNKGGLIMCLCLLPIFLYGTINSLSLPLNPLPFILTTITIIGIIVYAVRIYKDKRQSEIKLDFTHIKEMRKTRLNFFIFLGVLILLIGIVFMLYRLQITGIDLLALLALFIAIMLLPITNNWKKWRVLKKQLKPSPAHQPI